MLLSKIPINCKDALIYQKPETVDEAILLFNIFSSPVIKLNLDDYIENPASDLQYEINDVFIDDIGTKIYTRFASRITIDILKFEFDGSNLLKKDYFK